MRIETMKIVLEALENLSGRHGKEGDVAVWRLGGSDRAQQAIAALRQAIAEAEPEPVAKTYDMARFQVPEGMYSIKELEEMLADIKEAKKRQDDHLKVAMQ